MNKKVIGISLITCIFLIALSISLYLAFKVDDDNSNVNYLTASVISINDDNVTLRDSDNIIYTFGISDNSLNLGDTLKVSFDGELNKNKEIQRKEVLDYKTINSTSDSEGILSNWQDNGIFSDFYIFAAKKLKTMSLDEKIAQLLLVRYPLNNQVSTLEKYQFGGFIFFEKDFKDKSKSEVKEMINDLQNVSKVPILTAVDEEGGTVVRVSS